jgi:glycosyltransferase involved in cell wall biosynthesis
MAPLTIGLPVYNGEQFLEEALESILGQTFTDFSLVVSDNASTDGTMEILEAHAARDDRLVILRSETNRGSAWNFNRVFAGCATPFFKWAAADDMLAPTCVERCLEVLTASPPSVVLAFPRTTVIDDNGEPLGELVDSLAMRADAPVHARLKRVVAKVMWGNVIFAVIRSDGLRRTRLHGAYPSSDHVLLAELALVGSFVEVPEPLFQRRWHAGMSRRANASLAEASRFFDPAAKPVTNEFSRVFQEHLAAIDRATLTPSERRRVRATFFAAWGLRRAKLNPRVMRVRSTLQLGTRARRIVARLGAQNAGRGGA